jgi:ketosteroid isomerase-like protein
MSLPDALILTPTGDDLAGLTVEGPLLLVMGTVAIAIAEALGDPDAAAAVAMHAYRKLADRGLVCRQTTPAGQPVGSVHPPTP